MLAAVDSSRAIANKQEDILQEDPRNPYELGRQAPNEPADGEEAAIDARANGDQGKNADPERVADRADQDQRPTQRDVGNQDGRTAAGAPEPRGSPATSPTPEPSVAGPNATPTVSQSVPSVGPSAPATAPSATNPTIYTPVITEPEQEDNVVEPNAVALDPNLTSEFLPGPTLASGLIEQAEAHPQLAQQLNAQPQLANVINNNQTFVNEAPETVVQIVNNPVFVEVVQQNPAVLYELEQNPDLFRQLEQDITVINNIDNSINVEDNSTNIDQSDDVVYQDGYDGVPAPEIDPNLLDAFAPGPTLAPNMVSQIGEYPGLVEQVNAQPQLANVINNNQTIINESPEVVVEVVNNPVFIQVVQENPAVLYELEQNPDLFYQLEQDITVINNIDNSINVEDNSTNIDQSDDVVYEDVVVGQNVDVEPGALDPPAADDFALGGPGSIPPEGPYPAFDPALADTTTDVPPAETGHGSDPAALEAAEDALRSQRWANEMIDSDDDDYGWMSS